jgi:hypothetical protein
MLCRNYAVTEYCPYGPHCQFIHKRYQGPITQDYLTSLMSTQTKKPKKQQMKALRNVAFSGEDDPTLRYGFEQIFVLKIVYIFFA